MIFRSTTESASTTAVHAALLAANLQVLQQGLDLLAQVDDEQYTLTAGSLFAYGVGSHLRHCLDSYACFLHGLPRGRVDYDQRQRDELTAQDRRHASARLAWTMESLRERLAQEPPDELQVRQDSPHWAWSSVTRELQFLLSHTVHHYALMALILRLQGFNSAAEFGVAPSTLQHWQHAEVASSPNQQEAACAR
ncbi:MAG: DinB family protein [Acidobacteria bacterium]|nr:DinB family protein [Acidobacteriota bacterium]MBI3421546.1 DinB family protein [Acidobacteriota bacterium]